MGTKLIGNVGLQYELHNGESGSAMGQFFDHVQIPVEVGIPRRATVVARSDTPVAPVATEPKEPQPTEAAQPTRPTNWAGDGEAAQAIGRLGRRGCLRGLLDAVDGCAHGPPAYATPSAPVPARRPFARDEAVEPPRVAQSRW